MANDTNGGVDVTEAGKAKGKAKRNTAFRPTMKRGAPVDITGIACDISYPLESANPRSVKGEIKVTHSVPVDGVGAKALADHVAKMEQDALKVSEKIFLDDGREASLKVKGDARPTVSGYWKAGE